MATSLQLFDWPTADKALDEGWQVRRVDWLDRWMVRWNGGIEWIVYNNGTKHVVRWSDFEMEEFLALDWTNLPPSCITSGTTTISNGCPVPYVPKPTPVVPPHSFDPGEAPTVFGGGGMIGGRGGNDDPPPPTPGVQPVLTITIQELTHATALCLNQSIINDAIISGTVSMSNPEGYKGPTFYQLRLNNGNTPVLPEDIATIHPGESKDIYWPVPQSVSAGGAITIFGRARANDYPDVKGSGSAPIKSFCNGCLGTEGMEGYPIRLDESCGEGYHHHNCINSPNGGMCCAQCLPCSLCYGPCDDAQCPSGYINAGVMCADPECPSTCNCVPYTG